MAAEHADESPLTQFEIHRMVEMDVGGVDVSFTNSSLWMVIIVATATLLLTFAMRKRAMVPGRGQSIAELSYEFVASMVRDNVGSGGRRYFPFIFTLFIFILFSNVMGLIPFSFTVTSHIIVTFAMAIVVFVGVTLIGFIKHKHRYLTLFVPEGIPLVIAPLVVVIELISYLARPITLSLRLFANMMAGHTLLEVFGGFVVALGIFGIAPLLVSVALFGLEIIVAFLQAYVFAVLSALYLNDALHLHH